VGEYLLVSKYEEILSHFEFDSDKKLDDCAFLCVVVNGNSDDEDDHDFVWEDVSKRHIGDFMGSVGPQGAAKRDRFSSCFSNRELV
jgi:hypothetical protein